MPGVHVHHVHAGPFEGLSKGELPGQLCTFAREVLRTEASLVDGANYRQRVTRVILPLTLRTVLLVTHDVVEALTLAPRVVLLDDGLVGGGRDGAKRTDSAVSGCGTFHLTLFSLRSGGLLVQSRRLYG